jgi:hypothetical protein
MARLPTYQQTGRIFTSLPQLDFVNVRESMKRSQGMMAGLDRLSSFASQQAGEQAQKAAFQSALNQPITVEELREAEKSGITAEDLVKAQGGGKIFQDTLRKVQAEQLRNQLEVEANKESLSILNKVKTGELTNSQEIESKFSALLDGMAKPLNQLDPETAIKFQRTTASLIQNIEKASFDKLAENYQFGQQIATNDYKLEAVSLVSNVIDTEVDPEVINAKLSLVRKTFANLAMNGGTSFASKEIAEFDKEIETIRVSSLAKFALNPSFASNSFEAINRINNGDFGDKSEFYNSLPIQEQTKIRLAVRDTYNDEISARDKQEEIINKESEMAFKEKLVGKNPTNVYDIAFKNNVITIAQWKEAKSPEKLPGSNPIVISKIRNQVLDGVITDINQLPSGLNAKEIADFNNLIYDTDFKKTQKKLRTAAGIPEQSLFVNKAQGQRLSELTMEYEANLEKTTKDGTPLYSTKIDAAEAAIGNREKSSVVQDAVKSQTTAAKAWDRANLKINIDANYNIEELTSYAIKILGKTDGDKLIKHYKRYKKNQEQTGKNLEDLDI